MTRFLGLACVVIGILASFGMGPSAGAPASRDGDFTRTLTASDVGMHLAQATTPAPAPSTAPSPSTAPTPPAPATPPAAPNTTQPPASTDAPPPPGDGTQPPAGEETQPPDEPSLGEVEEVKIVDLNPDMAQRALDAYVLLKDKYKDAQLENYESLQDFVDKDPQGKAFETDVKAAGFATVDEWNVAITTVSNAYSNIINDQSADVNQQIDEVQKDPELAQDMKDRLTHSLKALIPTENNRKVVQGLIDNAANADKLKQLDTEEE